MSGKGGKLLFSPGIATGIATRIEASGRGAYLSRLVKGNAALHGPGQSLWLLVDLLLHEMVITSLHDVIHL